MQRFLENMPNRKYRSGARYERSVIDGLTRKSYSCYRAAGSRGVFDVIAYNNRICRFIQVKSTARGVQIGLYKEDLNKIFNEELPHFCTKELWVYGRIKNRRGVLKVCVL